MGIRYSSSPDKADLVIGNDSRIWQLYLEGYLKPWQVLGDRRQSSRIHRHECHPVNHGDREDHNKTKFPHYRIAELLRSPVHFLSALAKVFGQFLTILQHYIGVQSILACQL